MKNWNVSGTSDGVQYLITDGDDWGKEVINGVGIDSISHVELIYEKENVMFYLRKGVIHIGEKAVKLGVNLGGYLYNLFDECLFTVVEMAPFTTAMYTYGEDGSKDLGKHLMVKYKITHIVDKITKEKTKLPDPIIREYLFYLDEYGYLTVC